MASVDEPGQAEVHRNEAGGEAVSKRLNRRLAMRSFLHQMDNSRHGRIVANLLRPYGQVAGLDHRARKNRVAGLLVYRHELAGNRGLINGRLARLDSPVHTDLFAGLHHDAIADPHLLDRDLHLPSVLLKPPDVSLAHGQHVANRAARPVHRVDGEQLGQVRQTDDGQGRSVTPGKQTRDNGRGTERIGVGLAAEHQRAPAAAQDGQRQRETRQGGHRREAAKKGGGHFARGHGAESQRDRAGDHARQDFAHGLLLQTAFLRCRLCGQLPFRLEDGQGILVESRLCGCEDILRAALCLVEVNQYVFGDWAHLGRADSGQSPQPSGDRQGLLG